MSSPIVKVETTFPLELITLYLAPTNVACPCGVVVLFSLSTFVILILPPKTLR